MKKLNRKLIRGTNWALAGILSLLGFSGCGEIFQLEYGSPNADFKVTGYVTDEQGRPLSGVRIVAPNVDGKWGKQDYPSPHDTTYTGPDGKYTYRYNSVGASDSLYIKLRYEDPTARPAYKSDSVTVGFAKGDLKGGDRGWYLGAAEKEVNVTLKRKYK